MKYLTCLIALSVAPAVWSSPQKSQFRSLRLQAEKHSVKDLAVGAEKDWKSGNIFTNINQNNRRGRSDPWWMRDEEKNNPRVLPKYLPWWLTEDFEISSQLKVQELRIIAERRGIAHTGLKKADIITALEKSAESKKLTDDNFTVPTFSPPTANTIPRCYPEIYEDSLDSIESLRLKIMSATAAPSGRKT